MPQRREIQVIHHTGLVPDPKYNLNSLQFNLVDIRFLFIFASTKHKTQAYLGDIMDSVPDHCNKMSYNHFSGTESCLQFVKKAKANKHL